VPEPDSPVLYEEADGIAVVTLNRPERMNTLNEAVIEGLARSVDRAAAAEAVSAVVLRGAGRTFSAGYDLDFARQDDGPRFRPHNYGAPRVEPRPGAWDPVRDLHMMGHNVERFMRVWHCPKPVVGELRGWAVGGATDLLLCCDVIFMGEKAHIGYAPSRIYGTPTTMMWIYRLGLEHAKRYLLSGDAIDAPTAHRIGLVSEVHPEDRLSERTEAFARRFRHIPANQLALNKLLINQAYENMGLRTTQLLGTFFDGVTRHTEEAYRWVESFAQIGFRETIRRRDAPFADYGEAPAGED